MTVTAPTPNSQTQDQKCKVLLVDDSVVVRTFLRRSLEKVEGVQIVGSASNGEAAVKFVEGHDVDLVILDIEMPLMDGITALPKILAHKKDLIVLMASTLTQRNAEISLKALQLGATDYIPKPSTDSLHQFEDDLKFKVAGFAKRVISAKTLKKSESESVLESVKTLEPTNANTKPYSLPQLDAVVIGSSTGGPQALVDFLKDVGNHLECPIFIAQHMPPVFTTMLAKNLEKVSGYTAKEGEDGEIVKRRTVYVAPGDFHMSVVSKGVNRVIKLDQGPQENYCRPSVNPLFRTASKVYNKNLLAFMLTGMGADGLEGSQELIDNGSVLLAQDEATSIVWGMPKAVYKAGLTHEVLPLDQLRSKLHILAARNKRK